MKDKGLLIAACHHTILITLVLCIYTAQTNPLVIHNQINRAGKISFQIILTGCRYKQTHIKMDNWGGAAAAAASQGINQSEHTAEQKLLVEC